MWVLLAVGLAMTEGAVMAGPEVVRVRVPAKDVTLEWTVPDRLYIGDRSEIGGTLGAAVGNFAYIDDDIDGQPRAGKRDIGCDQRSDEAIVHRPLTPGDVGPPWRRAVRPGIVAFDVESGRVTVRAMA